MIGVALVVAFVAHLLIIGRLMGGNGKWYPTGGCDDA